MTEHISEHISLKEATKSHTAIKCGIDNKPGRAELAAMKIVAVQCFEPCREYYGGKALGVGSFFRCLLLNRALGSKNSSFHVFGMAIDIDADIYDHHTNKQIFDFFYQNKRALPFTELVWEYGSKEEPAWVHIAYNPADKRRMVKRAYMNGGKAKIIPFDLY